MEIAPSAHSFAAPTQPEAVAAMLRAAPSLVLFLDYDGTLVPFAARPELAAPDADLVSLLEALAARPGTEAHILSGRDAPTLARWLGGLPITLHGEHGLWTRDARPGAPFRASIDVPPTWKAALLPLLDRAVAHAPGALVEDKPSALAWHYRSAHDPRQAAMVAKALARELDEASRGLPVALSEGDHVLEMRLRGIDKGGVVTRVCDAHQQPFVAAAFGDDRTDEDMFAALPPAGLSVHIGSRPSRAAFNLADVAACRRALAALVA